MGQTLSCCYSAEIENKHESTSKEPAQPENTPSKEEKYDWKTKGQQQIKMVEATKSEVLTGYDSELDYDSESELLPPKAHIKKLEATSQELAQLENTPSKEEKYDCKTKGRQQIKELEPTLQGDAQAKKTTKSEVLTGDDSDGYDSDGYDSEYDSDGYDYDSESELLPPKAQIKELEATSKELAQLENTPIKEEKSDRKTKGQQQIKELEPRLQRDAKAKKTPVKKGTSACDRALEKLRRKQAKDLEAPPQIKTPRPIGPDLCELNLTKYMISRLFDFIM